MVEKCAKCNGDFFMKDGVLRTRVGKFTSFKQCTEEQQERSFARQFEEIILTTPYIPSNLSVLKHLERLRAEEEEECGGTMQFDELCHNCVVAVKEASHANL